MKKFADYKEENNFRDELLRNVAAQFPGSELPSDDNQHPRGTLKLGGEEALWLCYDSYKHRLSISGDYPRSRIAGDSSTFYPSDLYNPKEESPSISVDADKSPEQIKKDIERRLLPDYRRVLVRCLEKRQQHEDYVNGVNSVSARLAKKFGAEPRGVRQGYLQTHVYLYDFVAGNSVDVEVARERVDLKFSVPTGKAEKVLEFLKNL